MQPLMEGRLVQTEIHMSNILYQDEPKDYDKTIANRLAHARAAGKRRRHQQAEADREKSDGCIKPNAYRARHQLDQDRDA